MQRENNHATCYIVHQLILSKSRSIPIKSSIHFGKCIFTFLPKLSAIYKQCFMHRACLLFTHVLRGFFFVYSVMLCSIIVHALGYLVQFPSMAIWASCTAGSGHFIVSPTCNYHYALVSADHTCLFSRYARVCGIQCVLTFYDLQATVFR